MYNEYMALYGKMISIVFASLIYALWVDAYTIYTITHSQWKYWYICPVQNFTLIACGIGMMAVPILQTEARIINVLIISSGFSAPIDTCYFF